MHIPNYCMNCAEVKGKKAELVALQLMDEDLSFEKLVPTPPALLKQGAPVSIEQGKKNMEKFGAVDWYWWRVKNWGTKCDAGSGERWRSRKGKLVVNFDSAWGPPLAAFMKFSELHPGLTITVRYCEPGMDFAGIAVIKGGMIEDDCHEPMTKADKKWWGMCEEEQS